MSKQKLTFEPSAHIAGKYEVINTTMPIYYHRTGKVDFRTITEARAAELVDAGSMYIRKVSTKKAGKKVSS